MYTDCCDQLGYFIKQRDISLLDFDYQMLFLIFIQTFCESAIYSVISLFKAEYNCTVPLSSHKHTEWISL